MTTRPSIKRFCGEANCFSIPLKNVKFPFEKRFPNGGRLYSAKKPTQEEFDFGLELAAQGKKVEIRGAKLEQGPDFVIDGELWELKTITGNTLTERIDDTVKQVGRYNSQLVQQNQTTIPVRGYIDVRKTLLSEEDVKNQVIRSSLNADPKRFSGLKNPPLGTEIRIIIPGGKVIVWPWE